LIVWSEDIATSAAGRGRGQQRLRRWLARRATAFIAWGRPATSYLIDGLEVQAGRVFRCAQAIDNDWWLQRASTLDRSQCRAAAGCSGTVFLLVGRLVQRKGFAYFLSAWARLPAELHERAMVVIVGEGEQRAELERLIASHAMRNVRLVGAKPPTELAAYYAAADVFVLPSLEDVWGLVVNEAMCFGLPVLASGQAGSAQELIAGRGCGEVFNPVNVEQFGELLSVWARAVPAYDADHIHSVVSGCSIETSVQGISSAIQYCVSRTARVRSP
jgi:glycosyltransferase involved in cell wall biosynthesis